MPKHVAGSSPLRELIYHRLRKLASLRQRSAGDAMLAALPPAS